MRSGWRLAEALLFAACVTAGCGKGPVSGSVGPSQDGGSNGGGGGGGGGTTDGGTSADGGVTITIPTADGWTFFSAKDGLASSQIMGASDDEGTNLWVAGGTAGVFVQRAGSSSFQRFGLADGLNPYGYMPDGSPSDKNPYLEAISISGGPAGTAFVGYMGKTVPGALGCEDNWDGPNPDPAVYKSGDADKVTLSANGISVVHYDIFSGPNVVRAETRGREKLCNIVRIVYQHGTNWVWFGGNHGFALGLADFAGNPTCNGQYPGMQLSTNCAGVWEHAHPAVNGYASNDPGNNQVWFLTEDYYGIAVDPKTQDVWFGGQIRTTRFRFATSPYSDPIGRYYDAESKTEDPPYASNRIDVWPDQVSEPNIPRPSQRVDDSVSGIAAMNDGSAWIGSFARGLRHISDSGALLEDATAKLIAPNLGALARDPSDEGLWIGYRWGGGVSRLMPSGSIQHYEWHVLGDLANSPVRDIQIQGSGASRKVLVAFEAGVVGVFSGK
jgi:hypothetical protein